MIGDVKERISLIGQMMEKAQVHGVMNAVNLGSDVSVGRTVINRIQGNRVFLDTTENWNAQVDYVPEAGDIIAYTDRGSIETESGIVYVPGLKLGDGNAHLIDLPFIDAVSTQRLMEHISDPNCHVSAEDRVRWDNKLNCTIDNEHLILNRD